MWWVDWGTGDPDESEVFIIKQIEAKELAGHGKTEGPVSSAPPTHVYAHSRRLLQ